MEKATSIVNAQVYTSHPSTFRHLRPKNLREIQLDTSTLDHATGRHDKTARELFEHTRQTVQETNWKNKSIALPDTRLATTSTATGLHRLPMRQKPWAGNHRTRRLYKNSNEGPPLGRTNIPTSIPS